MKQTLIFNKQSLRDAIPKETYQDLLCAFGSSKIDTVCSALLADSIDLIRDMQRKKCEMGEVILRHVEPVSYLNNIYDEVDEDSEMIERDFTEEEFKAVYSGIEAVASYVEGLLPEDSYGAVAEVTEVKPINRYLTTVTTETADKAHPKMLVGDYHEHGVTSHLLSDLQRTRDPLEVMGVCFKHLHQSLG